MGVISVRYGGAAVGAPRHGVALPWGAPCGVLFLLFLVLVSLILCTSMYYVMISYAIINCDLSLFIHI